MINIYSRSSSSVDIQNRNSDTFFQPLSVLGSHWSGQDASLKSRVDRGEGAGQPSKMEKGEKDCILFTTLHFFCFNDIFDIGRPGHSLHVIDKDKQNNVDGVDELNSDGGILWPGARPGGLSVDGKLGVL